MTSMFRIIIHKEAMMIRKITIDKWQKTVFHYPLKTIRAHLTSENEACRGTEAN